MGYFDDILEEKLLNMHTAYFAKVIRMNDDGTCDIQPLDKTKAYGKTAKQHAPVTKVPILKHVSPQKGSIVFCVCAERDITSSVKGMSSVPPVGHHQISNAVVVGMLGG